LTCNSSLQSKVDILLLDLWNLNVVNNFSDGIGTLEWKQ